MYLHKHARTNSMEYLHIVYVTTVLIVYTIVIKVKQL